jgi:TolB-like protein/DNA-binding winged helix-turn-helix (wHTH) protein/Tfp pilus assembly protein PilF
VAAGRPSDCRSGLPFARNTVPRCGFEVLPKFWKNSGKIITKRMSLQAKQLYVFGPFRFDEKEQLLLHDGKPVPLAPKLAETLLLLLQNAGHVVDKDNLIKGVWPDTFVEDGNLNKNVFLLRKALGQWDGLEYIETVPKRGYRFIEVERVVIEPTSGHNEDAATKSGPLPPRSGRLKVVAGVLSLVLTLAGIGWLLWSDILHGRASSSIRSIAVLPLENLSGDAAQDYFADGMTDELITNLGQIASLRVISRTSSVRYKGAHKPLPQIANELDVDAVVEGAVLRSGDRIRITAQLIQARTDRHLWAESYEGNTRDILRLQGQIAVAIATQIRSRVTSEKQVFVKTSRTANPEAYESYWKGEYYLDKLTRDSLQKAAVYFEDAVAKDPSYVAAYDKLSAVYQMLGNVGALPKKESQSKAELTLNEALALDPSYGPAHAGKAWGALLNDLDFTTAEAEFQRAVQLSPNAVQGHQGLAEYYAAVGKMDQAVLEMERAREVDPLSFIVNFDVCRILYFARRFDAALAQCKANLDLDAKSHLTRWNIEEIYQAKGMDTDAASAFLQASETSGAPPELITTLKKAQRESGLRGMCEASLLWVKPSNERQEDLIETASVYTCAGDKEKALVTLKRAIDERSFGIVWLGVDPTFDSLRSDRQFQDLLHRMNLPQ